MHEFFTFRPENRINTIISMNIFPMEEKFLKHDLKSLIKPLRLNNSFNSIVACHYIESISVTPYFLFLVFLVNHDANCMYLPALLWVTWVENCLLHSRVKRKTYPTY